MVKTGNDCLLGNYISSRGKNCYGSLLRGSVVPTVLLDTLSVEDETPNALIVVWVGNGASCVSRDVTLHRLSAYSCDSLALHLSTAVCIIQGKECLRVIHVLSLSPFLLSLPVLHARFVVPSESLLRTWWRSSWLFSVDPRQYIMSTTEELLARLVNLENEAVQARQRQGSAKQALAAAQQRIQQLSSGGSAPTPSTGVIDMCTLGKPKTSTGQPAEWTNWQFTFKAFACATHARMREVFQLAT